MHLALSDWLLLAAIVLVIPVYAYFSRRRLAQAGKADRRFVYGRTIATLWLLALVTLFAWWHHGRSLAALGFALPQGAVTIAAVAACAMAAGSILLRIRSTARMAPAKAASLRDRLGNIATIVPRTSQELIWFYGVALSAGICEEFLYRGYFFAICAPYVSAPLFIAASALAFGLGHAYQGIRGVALTAAVGLFLGAFYVLTGSIVWPMILHVLIDVNGGTVGYLILRERTPAPQP